MLDSPYIGLRHVATGPFDLCFLIFAEGFGKEFVYCLATLSFADPNNTRSVKIIYDSGVFMSFAVRDFINADRFKASNLMPVPSAGDRTMELVRQS